MWSVYNYELICIVWRKVLKIMWQTHGCVFDLVPLVVQLKTRFVKFMCNALELENPVVRYMAKVETHS